MNTKRVINAFVLLILLLLSSRLSAQEYSLRFIPFVGDTLDPAERDVLGLFPDVDKFQWAIFRVNEDGGNLRGKVCSIRDGRMRYQIVQMHVNAEFIRRKIEGEFGKETEMAIVPLAKPVPMPVPQAATVRPSAADSGASGLIPGMSAWITNHIQFAENTHNLPRPVFFTPHADIAIGASWKNFSGIKGLMSGPTQGPDTSRQTGSNDVGFRVSLFLHVPFSRDPNIDFVGGWGFDLGGAQGGTLIAFSAMIAVELPSPLLPFKPTFGIGFGHSSYSYSGNVIIEAGSSYPFLAVGLNLAPNLLNIVATFPLMSTKITTSFESRSYSIEPAGPTLALVVCL